jgi:uncharacterized protein DUF6116
MNPRSIAAGGLVSRLFGHLRFPQLFAVLAGLLLLDLVLPDPIPFLDEIILAVLTMVVGSWKVRDDTGGAAYQKPPEKDITPRGSGGG